MVYVVLEYLEEVSLRMWPSGLWDSGLRYSGVPGVRLCFFLVVSSEHMRAAADQLAGMQLDDGTVCRRR